MIQALAYLSMVSVPLRGFIGRKPPHFWFLLTGDDSFSPLTGIYR